MEKFLPIIFILIFIGAIAFFALNFIYSTEDFVNNNQINQNAAVAGLFQPNEKENTQIIFFAVGDIMLNRGVEYKIKKEGGGDFNFPFLKIADHLKKSDILFGNLESVISNKGRKVGSINSFRADPKATEGLTFAGFDIVSVCNNHTLDYTSEAMEDSFKRLEEAGIKYAGGGFNEEEAFSPKIVEAKNTKIGFLAYCNLGSKLWRAGEKSSGIAFVSDADLEKIKEDIAEAKKQVDVLAVSFHWGDEYVSSPNSSQEKWGKAIIDAGADLVIGHHPHVVQPVEKYNQGWIAYSLGNFVFDQWFSEKTMQGLALEVKIEDKKIKEVHSKAIKMTDNFQPYFPSD
jgi:poly-gamma-glutamate synthesis protein (capsule biosynthesis protein)